MVIFVFVDEFIVESILKANNLPTDSHFKYCSGVNR